MTRRIVVQSKHCVAYSVQEDVTVTGDKTRASAFRGGCVVAPRNKQACTTDNTCWVQRRVNPRRPGGQDTRFSYAKSCIGTQC